MLTFYLVLSIGVSFLCSLFEAVILSISPAFVASMAESDNKWGKELQRLKTNLDDSLSAILTLNTISHTVGAAGVGAEVLRLYGDQYIAIASAILTILILFVSEIIPKTLGATYSRFFAPVTAIGIRLFIFLTYPFVLVCKLLARFIGPSSHLTQVTRDEVVYTAAIGSQEGTLTEEEATIIKNLLRLRKVRITDIMTPRPVVFALEENASISEIMKQYPTLRFSRIPVYDESIDQISGMVFRYEIVATQAKGETDRTLKDIKQPIHHVSDSMNIAKVFEIFLKRREHLFAVYDDHGGFDGVVTLEDVIETLLGVEILDESDSVEDMRAYAKKRWEERSKVKQEYEGSH